MRMLCLALLLLVPGLSVVPVARADGPAAADRDGDGLSDFDEVHKYRTDPDKADTDGDGIPDGDWNERREYTYSIGCVVWHLPPAMAVSDGWQDAREIRRDDDGVEIEIVAYPLATPVAPLEADAKRTVPAEALAPFVRPNLTNDFDDAMRTELVAALAADGIRVEGLGDRTLVERVSRWAMDRVDTGHTGFTICCVTARDGRLAIEAGLEEYARKARSDPTRSLEEQLDVEVRGKSMFRKAQSGSCTSTAVYLQTILRALGMPTRTTVAMPPCDATDPAQVALVRAGLRPSAFRDAILAGLDPNGWVEHTFNEVWVGGRWMRLNYADLGQPIVDRAFLGLLLRILDYDDRATSGTAATWGRRYALGHRSARFPSSNPYRLVSIADRMGEHADIALPAPAPEASEPPREHDSLTIVGARWGPQDQDGFAVVALDCKEWFPEQGGDQYKRFTQVADPVFWLRAEGGPEVEVRCAVGSFTEGRRHGVSLFVPAALREALAGASAIDVVPRNAQEGHPWRVAPGVVLAGR
jgi:Transglutaminase-like superfamily